MTPQIGTIAWLTACIKRGRTTNFTVDRALLTPEIASHLLSINNDNRNIRRIALTRYTKNITDGQWIYNGESIKVSSTGELNDGQHRCEAVVKTGIPIEVDFKFGLDRDSRKTLDQPATRIAADYLRMGSTVNSETAAAVTRVVLSYEAADRKRVGSTGAVTNAEIVQRVMTDSKIAESAEFASQRKRFCINLLKPHQVGFLHYILTDIDASDADLYLDQILQGVNIGREDAAFAVRTRLISDSRLTAAEKIELALRGWVAFRRKRPVHMVRINGQELPQLK